MNTRMNALTPSGLRGKVVLVDFWTLTCVNWLRTLPYVIRQPKPIGDRTFEIEFLDPGAEAFCFTFG